MRCPKCGGPMTALFYTSVCDTCDSGRIVYYACRGPLIIGPFYWSRVHARHEHAALSAGVGGRVEPVALEGPLREGVDYWICPANDPPHKPPDGYPVARYTVSQ